MRLSVIVPAHNNGPFLARALKALASSTFRDYEIVVVDDASTDDTPEVAARAGVRVLRLDRNGGPARARNRGAEVATGEFLVFVDADVCVHPDTLGRFDAHFRANPEVVAVMGSYDDTPADPGFVSQFKNLMHHYVHHRSRRDAWTFWAGCGAVRRDVFLRFGGFDENYRRPCIEDIELGNRMAAAGLHIDLDPTIQATHLKRWTLAGLVRTDIRDRGVPWFLLMRHNRHMPADLNVTGTQRASVALVGLLLALLAALSFTLVTGAGFMAGIAALGAASAASALVYLNRDCYRYLARKRGPLFALGAIPMHWLYFLYCGISVALAFAVLAWARLTGRWLVPGPWVEKTRD
ncbi:glycosyltransferase family 2 protein [Candidatus Binatia bacterium]|nr:glycosyltransferase family 2 protein [Candidatus Binatia bacterium]